MAKNQKNQAEEQELVQPSVIEKYGKQMGIGIAAVLVVVLACMGYKNFISEPNEKAAAEAIPAAQDALSEGTDSVTMAKVLKAAELVADEYGSTANGNLANLYAGIALYNQGKYQEALDKFKDFSDCGDQMISPTVYQAIGNCYACLKQYDEAVSYLTKAADQADNANLSPLFLIQAGEIYEMALNNKDKALECYNKAKTYKASYQVQSGAIDEYIERASNK